MPVLPSEFELAERIAKRVGRKWSAVEIEDLTSHLYLWLLERVPTLERYRQETGGEGKLYISLQRTANKYCLNEQEHANGEAIEPDGYKLETIVNAMPYIFDHHNWAQTTMPVNPRNGAAIGKSYDSNTLIELLADIKRCYQQLNKDQKAVLAMRFRDDLNHSEIADILGVTKMTALNRIARALKSLQSKLNGNHDNRQK